jgi:predicted lipoprotein with Yx(FWY)xxD motif
MNNYTTNQKNNISRLTALLIVMLTVALIMPVTTFSQWQGNPVSVAVNDQINPMITTDGSGGSIMTWQDKRGGNTYDIYAQRMDPNGTAMWTTNGVVICSADSSQINPKIAIDGSGGAIICWEDKRNSTGWDIYAQRVNSNGQIQWSNNGVPVCTSVFDQDTLAMISDGLNGVIMTWQDYRSNNGFADIYAQRVNSSGAMLWTANGVNICNQAAAQRGPKLVSDGSGGAFITWFDNRAGNYDIYTQRVASGGAVQWTTNGVATCTMAADQLKPDICSDGAGGVIVTWYDYRSSTDYNIYAQRLGPAGAIVWAVDGVVMNNNVAYDQIDPKIVSDGMGGAILSWTDYRTGTTADIYAQRVNSTGAVQWTATGVIICTSANDQIKSQLVSDGTNGAYITWEDHRNTGNSDIYAQRIASNAAINWAATGFLICSAPFDQFSPMIFVDGNLGAIVVWQDYHSGNNWDIYEMRFNTTGLIAVENTGITANEYSLSQNYPNPFNPVTVIDYQLPKSSNVKISIYDALGKQVSTLVNEVQNAGNHSITWNAVNFPSGVYFYRLDAESFYSIKKMVLIK